MIAMAKRRRQALRSFVGRSRKMRAKKRPIQTVRDRVRKKGEVDEVVKEGARFKLSVKRQKHKEADAVEVAVVVGRDKLKKGAAVNAFISEHAHISAVDCEVGDFEKLSTELLKNEEE